MSSFIMKDKITVSVDANVFHICRSLAISPLSCWQRCGS